MVKRLKSTPLWRSLPAQLILSSVGLVLLTALAAGLPARWLLRNQLERQAWVQVDQGSRAAQALYLAHQNELINLATLTAQRPTLHRLLDQADLAPLNPYLRRLQTGAGLDLIAVCDAQRRAVAWAGPPAAEALCAHSPGPAADFVIALDETGRQIWLIAGRPVQAETTGRAEIVMAGRHLNQTFAAQMEAQTGLAHTLLIDGRPVVSSLASAQMVSLIRQDHVSTYNHQPFYTARLPLAKAPLLEAEVALPVTGIAATQRSLLWTLALSMLAVGGVGSLLGVILARRLGRPLARLAEAATGLSRGELDKPIKPTTRVREIAVVSWALESARLDLRSILNDLQREKAWTDHLLEAIVEGIVTLDRQGRIIFFSRGAERVTGWSREQVVGHTCDEVFQVADSQAAFSQFLPAPGGRTKIAVTLRDKQPAILSITGANLRPPDGGEGRTVLVLRDVSEEEAMHRLLGQFLANIAHEFRTPLSALAASAELLLDQAPDLSPAELQELLTSLHLGVLGLQTLIDNLLESASIEAGRFQVSPRPADLTAIINEVGETIKPLLVKRGQSLRLDVPAQLPAVTIDPRRTAQVFMNLLSNASKYSYDGTEITLTVEAVEDRLKVMIVDQGPGISPPQRANLFHRFAAGPMGPDQPPVERGTGLGLSVVKAIVEAQGGQVGLEDPPQGGAAFWFTLPQASQA